MTLKKTTATKKLRVNIPKKTEDIYRRKPYYTDEKN